MDSSGLVSQSWNGEKSAEQTQTSRGFLPAAVSGTAAGSAVEFCGYPSTTHFVKDLRKKLSDVVGVADKLPQGEMNYLICSTYGDFVEKVSLGTSNITTMMRDLSHYWGIPATTWRHFESTQNKTGILQGIQDATKQLKERMDLTLDEVARLKEEQSQSQFTERPERPERPERAERAERVHVVKPQVMYGWKIDNSPTPFVPRLKVKHNALRPLDPQGASLTDTLQGGAPHPYQFELDVFEPEEESFVMRPPIRAKGVAECPFSFVDTKEEFEKTLLELSSAKELAVDLEHHSYRTYLGITCLIQISSRWKDYVIDCVSLRENIHQLNSIFSNSKILKIFHGGNFDILWLQRDFNVYVVNMFDTGRGARLLQFPRFSLAFLFQHYLGRIIDKTHQMSDWRIRPIPDDMLDYARSDTHDLLYLYDCLRNDLIKKDTSFALLKQVYAQSKEICLQRYEKQKSDVNDFALIMGRFSKNFSEQQKYALKGILQFRDKVARDLDESVGFVLPTKGCVDLAEELPRTSEDLVKCFMFLPVLVKQRIHQVLEVLREARAFTGIVPMPVSESESVSVSGSVSGSVSEGGKMFLPMEVDSKHQVIQRKIVQPLTVGRFAGRFLDRLVPVRTSELVWEKKDVGVASLPEDTEKMRLAHVWMHFQTVSVAEEEAEKAKTALEKEKPNVKVSVPLELPLAEVTPTATATATATALVPVKSAQNQSRNENQPKGNRTITSVTKLPVMTAPSTGNVASTKTLAKTAPPTGPFTSVKAAPPTGLITPVTTAPSVGLLAAPPVGLLASSSKGDVGVRTELSASASGVLQLPLKRPAFDYQTADYSKFQFSSAEGAGQKRRGGKQHPGGLKDPNKRFNKQRNMTDNSAKTSTGGATGRGSTGGAAGRFRKPE